MDGVTWQIQPHTQAKHELLRGYLGAWFPIVSTNSKRIIYFDAFAGPGIYAGGEPGSPLIALETLITHKSFPKMSGTEFLFAFIEKDNSKFQRLKQEIENFWSKQGKDKPANIEIYVRNDEFINTAQEVLNQLDAESAKLAPTLAFVDPFGWSKIRLDLMMQFVSFDKCEVLITFMVESISRFLSDPNRQKSLQDFFGTDRYRECISLSGNEKIECLQDLYINQLKKAGSFGYVTPFKMINKRGKAYFLIHCTRNIKGLQAMKKAMWNVDPTGNFQFEARWKGRQVLFGPDYIQDLKQEFIKEFKGREVSISDIETFVLTETLYLESHVKSTLRKMEDEGKISATNRRKKRTYPLGTIIRFL